MEETTRRREASSRSTPALANGGIDAKCGGGWSVWHSQKRKDFAGMTSSTTTQIF